MWIDHVEEPIGGKQVHPSRRLDLLTFSTSGNSTRHDHGTPRLYRRDDGAVQRASRH